MIAAKSRGDHHLALYRVALATRISQGELLALKRMIST